MQFFLDWYRRLIAVPSTESCLQLMICNWVLCGNWLQKLLISIEFDCIWMCSVLWLCRPPLTGESKHKIGKEKGGKEKTGWKITNLKGTEIRCVCISGFWRENTFSSGYATYSWKIPSRKVKRRRSFSGLRFLLFFRTMYQWGKISVL